MVFLASLSRGSQFGFLRLPFVRPFKIELVKSQRRNLADASAQRPVLRTSILRETYKNAKAERQLLPEAVKLASSMLSLGTITKENALDALNIFKLGQCPAKCVEVISALNSAGLTASMYHYSTAIATCRNGRDWRKALSLFEEMAQKGIKQDTISYNATISACEKGRQWVKALELFHEMERKGVHRDTIT